MSRSVECQCEHRFTCGHCLRNMKPYFYTTGSGKVSYVPSWKHSPHNFRRRMKLYAKNAATAIQKPENSSATQPVTLVENEKLDENAIALYPYTNQIMSLYPPVTSGS